MAAPNEGTTNLPSDATARFHLGVWDGLNYYAPRGDTTNGLDVDPTRPYPGTNALIVRGNVTFANSAAQGNTQTPSDISIPSRPQRDALYVLNLYNPGVAGVRVHLYNVETWTGPGTIACELTQVSVAGNATVAISQPVQGWLVGGAGRLACELLTTIGSSQGFSFYYSVYAV